jgi:hypothetical protein
MKDAVAEAIRELEQDFGSVRRLEDGEGGAYVLVEDVDLGEHYAPRSSWIAGHITWAYEEGADVYPLFIDAAVRYVGTGARPNQDPSGDATLALPTTMTRGNVLAPGFQLPAIQVSRQSNAPAGDTAAQKFGRVLEFIRTR